MFDLPLHPALVHLPIGIGVLAPLIAAVALALAWRTDNLRKSAWLVVVVMQAAAFGGGLAAAETGEDDEDRVEQVVQAAKIEAHEDSAKVFNAVAGAALGLGAIALLLRGPAARAAATLSLVLSLAAAGQVVRVGHSGGRLIYREGAAAVHLPRPAGAATDGRATKADGLED